MSSMSLDTSLIFTFQNISWQLNRYLAIFIFVFGFIGNAANILALAQKSLRSNPCARLFLFSSVANFIAICSGLISRFLSTWGMDLTNTNEFLCKLRGFLVFSSITCGFWLMVLSTVDRWLLSSSDASRRQQSSLKNAKYGTILVVILSIIVQGHHLYCFEANLISGPLKCYTRTVMCRLLSDLTFVLAGLLLPLISIIIFSCMTIANIRHVRSRVHLGSATEASATGTQDTGPQAISMLKRKEKQRKKIDRQLLKMLFVQVFLIIIFTLPLTVQKFYTTITTDTIKSPLQNTIETFLFNLFLLLYYVACGMPFYVNTLSGGMVFRKAVISLMKNVIRKLFPRCL